MNTLVGGIVYINLASRPERRLFAEAQLASVGLKAERFEAFHPNSDISTFPVPITKEDFTRQGPEMTARICCSMSHHQVIVNARDRGWKSVMIVEDDVQFKPNFTEVVDQCLETIRDLSIPCDVFYTFGVHGRYPVLVPGLLRRLDYSVVPAYESGCYIVFSHFYDTFLNFMVKAHPVHRGNDWQLVEMQKAGHNFVLTYWNLTRQKNGWSDIRGCEVSHDSQDDRERCH